MPITLTRIMCGAKGSCLRFTSALSTQSLGTFFMKVAHVIKATRISGAERHLLILLPALKARGVDVDAAAAGRPGASGRRHGRRS